MFHFNMSQNTNTNNKRKSQSKVTKGKRADKEILPILPGTPSGKSRKKPKRESAELPEGNLDRLISQQEKAISLVSISDNPNLDENPPEDTTEIMDASGDAEFGDGDSQGPPNEQEYRDYSDFSEEDQDSVESLLRHGESPDSDTDEASSSEDEAESDVFAVRPSDSIPIPEPPEEPVKPLRSFTPKELRRRVTPAKAGSIEMEFESYLRINRAFWRTRSALSVDKPPVTIRTAIPTVLPSPC